MGDYCFWKYSIIVVRAFVYTERLMCQNDFWKVKCARNSYSITLITLWQPTLLAECLVVQNVFWICVHTQYKNRFPLVLPSQCKQKKHTPSIDQSSGREGRRRTVCSVRHSYRVHSHLYLKCLEISFKDWHPLLL